MTETLTDRMAALLREAVSFDVGDSKLNEIEAVLAEYDALTTQTARIDIDVTPPDPEFDIATWNVVGDLRVTDDDEANYDAAADLRPRNRVQFDSEMSCFYAYCQTEADAVLLIHDLRTWVDTRRGA